MFSVFEEFRGWKSSQPDVIVDINLMKYLFGRCLSEHLVVFLTNIHEEIGQVELISEIFRNNKKLCLERHGEVCDDILRLIKTNGRQAKFLELFRIIQVVNDEVLVANQKVVLNLLFDPKFKHSVLYLKEGKETNFE